MSDTSPESILHCFTPEEWAAATDTGVIAPASLDTEGFVHCSTAAQIEGVLNRFYADVSDVVIGEIDLARLAYLAPDSEVRWEAPAHPDGTPNTDAEDDLRFPHVYGPIPVAAVTTTRVR